MVLPDPPPHCLNGESPLSPKSAIHVANGVCVHPYECLTCGRQVVRSSIRDDGSSSHRRLARRSPTSKFLSNRQEMSRQHSIHFESGLLRVDVSGEFSLEDAKQGFLELLGAVVQYKAETILVDGRDVKGNPKDIERFYYGEFAARETRRIVVEHKIVPRFAYVLHEPLRDPGRLGETVAVNRGMILKVFDTSEDAIEWLNSPR